MPNYDGLGQIVAKRSLMSSFLLRGYFISSWHDVCNHVCDRGCRDAWMDGDVCTELVEVARVSIDVVVIAEIDGDQGVRDLCVLEWRRWAVVSSASSELRAAVVVTSSSLLGDRCEDIFASVPLLTFLPF